MADQPAKGGLKIAGQTISPAILVIGGVVLLLLIIAGRGTGGGGGGSTAPDGTGLLAAELNQRIGDANEQSTRDAAEFRQSILDEIAEQGQRSDTNTQALADYLRSLAEANYFGGSLDGSGGGGTSPGPAPAPSPAPTPKPDDTVIGNWAKGIGLPFAWGRAFVDRFGNLPDSIAQLEQWRGQIGTQSGGKWCIAGECV